MPGLQAAADESDWKDAEDTAVQAAQKAAMKELSGVQGANDLHVRDILPDEDLEAGGDQTNLGWNGSNRVWLQGDMSSADLMNSYSIDAEAKAEGKVIAFYGVSAQQADPATTEIEFRDGTGNRFERLMFQESHQNEEQPQALLRNPVVYHEGHDGEIYQYSDDDSTTAAVGLNTDFVGDELVLHGVVAEQAGTTLGVRSGSESTPSGVARGPQ